MSGSGDDAVGTRSGGRHDDQVDATAQFLDWLRQPARAAGLFDYYRMLAEGR
jgi:hypothetical protein